MGYSFVDVGRTGIELSENDLLSGEQNEFASIIDQLSGSTRAGADITLTLDAGAQQVALDGLESAIASTGQRRRLGGRPRARHGRGQGDGLDSELQPCGRRE